MESQSLLLQRSVIPLGPDVAVRTDAGYLLVPGEDVALLVAMVESRGRMEPGTLKVIRTLLREGHVMIDVGASIGTLALAAAHAVGASGRVLALEPTPRIAALLRRSVALNGLDARLQVEQCAAGAANGEASFGLSANTTHNSLLPGEGERIHVALRSIDLLVAPGGRVDLVKIDAEGAEPGVWRGMRRVVAENPQLAAIVEFGPSHLRGAGILPEDWIRTFCDSGFTPWEIDEASGAVRPLRSTGLAEVPSINLLLLRHSVVAYLGLATA